ncbi:hypothetical protein B0H13DRAFT_2086745, partial [Mycena leptocephala]
YLARNNDSTLQKKCWLSSLPLTELAFRLISPAHAPCTQLVFGIDPRCRLFAQGAVSIAGVVAAIYPILLQPFDQVRFEPVTESEYLQIEKEFDAGRASTAEEVVIFEVKQKQAVQQQEEMCKRSLGRELEGTLFIIFRRPGDIITSEDITVAVLEIMKTEIPIKAGVAI